MNRNPLVWWLVFTVPLGLHLLMRLLALGMPAQPVPEGAIYVYEWKLVTAVLYVALLGWLLWTGFRTRQRGTLPVKRLFVLMAGMVVLDLNIAETVLLLMDGQVQWPAGWPHLAFLFTDLLPPAVLLAGGLEAGRA